MKPLRKLSAPVILMTVFAMSAFGQTMTPCPPPDPGQIMTPCDPGPPLAPGDIGTPEVTSISSGDVVTSAAADGETSFREIAADLFLSFLPLF